ncbi:MAG: zinc chelation protein SecC [Deltaproteobacteria bacterium]|nr:zinc chelation protein SecC [Deltaproteobacteria bacterium]
MPTAALPTPPAAPAPQPPCPCGGGAPLSDCCLPYLEGRAAPATPEQLMRSRYTAYARGDEPYVLKTWHSATRPPALGLSGERARWVRLEVLSAPPADAHAGTVRFRATALEGERATALEEVSRFTREGGEWRYSDGDARVTSRRVGRNEPCPCGRGEKLKRCCGR